MWQTRKTHVRHSEPYQQDSWWNFGVTPSPKHQDSTKKKLLCLLHKTLEFHFTKKGKKLVEEVVDLKRKMTSRTRRIWWWSSWWTVGVEKNSRRQRLLGGANGGL